MEPVPLSAPVEFHLQWTIGFSGKRFLGAAPEPAVRAAIREALNFLLGRAAKQDAELTTVSSVARGGDVLFAEEALSPAAGSTNRPLRWRCILPLPWDDFIRRDLAAGTDGAGVDESERASRLARAEACRALSLTAPVVTSSHLDPDDDLQRNEAYLECGYRTVDDADVMIVLLREEECDRLRAETHRGGMRTAAGSYAVATYAMATRRPVIVLNADAPDIWNPQRIINAPGPGRAHAEWFFDPLVTPAVRKASRASAISEDVRRERVKKLGHPLTPVRAALVHLGAGLGARANRHQQRTLVRLRSVLLFHLAASSMAAIGATILVVDSSSAVPAIWLFGLAVIALVKPALAFSALVMERRLHRAGNREEWLNARVLAEMVRGAIATWPLPIQPPGALDEDDFPRVRRLVRTLRLLREQDADAPVSASTRMEGETQVDADMRMACANYVNDRLLDQAEYYRETRLRAHSIERRWRVGFQAATWTAIALGLVLALDRAVQVGGRHLLVGVAERVLEAAIIIAPFVAAYCLGMMTVLDTRRRCRRYHELEDELRRLADTLSRTAANPSRVRLIEHAERVLLEEQHEWFSVMRNVSV